MEERYYEIILSDEDAKSLEEEARRIECESNEICKDVEIGEINTSPKPRPEIETREIYVHTVYRQARVTRGGKVIEYIGEPYTREEGDFLSFCE